MQVHYENSSVAPGRKEVKWAPQTTRDTTERIRKSDYQRNWTEKYV